MSEDESRSAAVSDQRRSRTPEDLDRKQRKPKRKDAGFKWKEKRRGDGEAEPDTGLNRGYKDHYKPRQRSRSRSRSPRRHSDRYENQDSRDRAQNRYRDIDRRRDDRDRDRDFRRRDIDEEQTTERNDRSDRNRDRHRDKGGDETKKEKPEKKQVKPQAPAAPQQEMILVTVNDRLGTKKQVPCLPSDTIKDFKTVVAMMIGRRPHEILLKRQSERPFKDFLTLQDYGISNNVQLDLEVDTGD